MERCPECRAPVDGGRWCGACGALLEAEGVAGVERVERLPGRGLRLGFAVTAVVAAVAVVVAVTGDDATAPAPAETAPAGTMEVEQAEVLPPSLPSPGAISRQFSARALTSWERTDLPAPGEGPRTLVSDGRVVSLLDRGEPVLTLLLATGEDVAGPAPTAPSGDLDFVVTGERVTVTVDGGTLRGVVGDEAAWTVALDAPLATAPVRAGTSVVVALTNGDVAAIAPSDGTARWRRDLGVQPTAVAGDGTVLLVGTEDGRVLRLDPSGTPVTTVQVGSGPVTGLTAGRQAVALLEDRLVGLDLAG